MKNFSWNYFCHTGQIDAYLLYKEYEAIIEIKVHNDEIKVFEEEKE